MLLLLKLKFLLVLLQGLLKLPSLYIQLLLFQRELLVRGDAVVLIHHLEPLCFSHSIYLGNQYLGLIIFLMHPHLLLEFLLAKHLLLLQLLLL